MFKIRRKNVQGNITFSVTIDTRDDNDDTDNKDDMNINYDISNEMAASVISTDININTRVDNLLIFRKIHTFHDKQNMAEKYS